MTVIINPAPGGVTSTFGRTGGVVAASGDYTAAQVTNAADKSSASAQAFTGVVQSAGGTKTAAITSGALPTVSPSSGTAFQCSTTRDVFLIVPITFTLLGSTLLVEISPDNVTFSTLVTKAPNLAGAIDEVSLVVPAAWRVKLTATNATIGTGTYY